jgi:chaperone BCS1
MRGILRMIGSWLSWYGPFRPLWPVPLICDMYQMKESVWRHSWNFKISAKTLQKKNGVRPSEVSKGHKSEHAEYVPTYQKPQIFRWNGYWIEITRNIDEPTYDFQMERNVTSSTIYLK